MRKDDLSTAKKLLISSGFFARELSASNSESEIRGGRRKENHPTSDSVILEDTFGIFPSEGMWISYVDLKATIVIVHLSKNVVDAARAIIYYFKILSKINSSVFDLTYLVDMLIRCGNIIFIKGENSLIVVPVEEQQTKISIEEIVNYVKLSGGSFQGIELNMSEDSFAIVEYTFGFLSLNL